MRKLERDTRITGMTRRTVDISAKRVIFPGLTWITTQAPLRPIKINPISAGKKICQNSEPLGPLFFSAIIPIL
jgi:hypothetical protein